MLRDTKQGIVVLLIKVEGLWVYQFSNAQKQALVKLIAGKGQQDAVALLLKQREVLKVDIETSWWVPPIIRDRLPADAAHIMLNVARE